MAGNETSERRDERLLASAGGQNSRGGGNAESDHGGHGADNPPRLSDEGRRRGRVRRVDMHTA